MALIDNKRRVLVTGGAGFVGSALLNTLLNDARWSVTASVRRADFELAKRMFVSNVGDLSPCTDWSEVLIDVDVVVHTAARVHVMNESVLDPLAEFRRVNVESTLRLASQAASAGVKRFVFISSIKVNGECTLLGQPYTADDTPEPVDPYGISKHEAELGLRRLADETGLEVTIIRPTLVYGPGVKANFLTMMRWLDKGVPLPLGAIHNKRSLVALDNLVDLIVTCLDHPAAANQTFLAGDGIDLSTTELLRSMGEALNRPVRLIPVPMRLLEWIAVMFGKRAFSQRLCGSLQVDIGKTRELLNWQPPINVERALTIVARDYLDNVGTPR